MSRPCPWVVEVFGVESGVDGEIWHCYLRCRRHRSVEIREGECTYCDRPHLLKAATVRGYLRQNGQRLVSVFRVAHLPTCV